MNRIIGIAGILGVFLIVPDGHSQDMTEEQLFFMEVPMVITAAKRVQPVEEAPAAVTVLTAEEIRLSGAVSLPELLRQVVGIEVMSFSPSDYVVGARGQNRPLENGILVLINGRSIYLDFFGIITWSSLDIPLEQIEKIEVVRGPGSVLYGANAFHAVINIITWDPGDNPGLSLFLTGGPDTIIGTVMNSGHSGNIRHLASAGWTQIGSYGDPDLITTRFPRAKLSLEYDLGNERAVQIEAGIASGEGELYYDMAGNFRATAIYSHVLAKYRTPGFYFRTFWNVFDIKDVYTDVAVLFHGIQELGMDIEVDEDWKFGGDAENHVLDCEVQKTFELGSENNLITVGGNFRYNTLDSTLVGGNYLTQRLYAAYFQHEYILGNYLHSYLGMRYDYHPFSGHQPSPRVSVVSSPLAGHTFRASAGMSYRNPTFVESKFYTEIPIMFTSFVYQGNDDLDPERMNSYETGYQSNFYEGRLKLSANLFFNRITGLIGPYFPQGLAGFTGSFDNEVDEDVYGAETEVRAKPRPWLSGFVNYAFTRVQINRMKLTDGWTDAEDFPEQIDEIDHRTPRHKVNAGLTARMGNDFSGTVLFHYASETSWPPSIDYALGFYEVGGTDAYYMFHLRLAYRFWNRKAEAAFYVFNLLNNDHFEWPETVVVSDPVSQRIAGSLRVHF